MHQQIRLRLAEQPTQDTPGAMPSEPVQTDPMEVRRGSLLKLLDTLAGKGYDLRSVGGNGIEGPGEFVFSLDDEDHERTGECAEFLRDQGYRNVRVVETHLCQVEDRPGGLAECLRALEDSGRFVHEMFVATPREGKVPVQFTTIHTSNEGDRGDAPKAAG
jgi:hypothetical protein